MADSNVLIETFSFTLPRGFVDENGTAQRQGKMRLATARDEIRAKSHRQVRQYPDYLTLVMLASVITELGTLSTVSAAQLEGLFTQDLSYLKTFYTRLNKEGHPYIPAHCPDCDRTFEVDLSAQAPTIEAANSLIDSALGEALATP